DFGSGALLKRPMASHWGKIILVCFLTAGCAGSDEKSELLSLLGVDEKIADVSSQDVENIFDALTLLKRGDAHFVKKEYAEASAEFQRFLALHPFHRMAPFAQYRIGMSFYNQMDTIDRDPEPMEKAMAALQKVLTDYPRSLYVEEAKEKIALLQRRQAEHHFYVGHFYYKTEAYAAAIARFEKVFSKEREGPLTEKTLYYLGLSHYYAGHREASAETFRRLLEKYPHSPYTSKSKKMLTSLDAPSSES
ncbi:MAG: outer membrane protein assembly factor BamD, partial [Nitrospiria bacterium]